MKVTVRCAECNIVLTKELEPIKYLVMLKHEQEEDQVPVGYFGKEQGNYIVNLKDVVNAKHHHDAGHSYGCCGYTDLNGLNTICINEHEVGTERSDCWTPHSMTFDKDAVWLDRIWV